MNHPLRKSAVNVDAAWDVVVGLEVHAQVLSNSKLFSSASANSSGAKPNSNVSLTDLAFPGTLPTLNSYCVEQAIRAGLALNATVHKKSAFDRKNYFYPDLPQGYQISQFYMPIITHGKLVICDGTKEIRINRAHLEQDAGKSLHDVSQDYTCLDFNRVGVALLEIVTEPDISSATEAVETIKKLQAVLRYVGVCSGDMESGALRCDANISVKRKGSVKLGTRCEIKNLNSLSSIAAAINYEIHSQIAMLEDGQKITQCTKLFDVDAGVTRFLRNKEDAADYRYFRDPDLQVLVLQDELIERIRADMPELPDNKKTRYEKQYELSAYDAGVLIASKETADYFEEAIARDDSKAKILANWITTELFGKLHKLGIHITESPVEPGRLSALMDLIIDGTVSTKIAKQVFELMFEDKCQPVDIVKTRGLEQMIDGIGSVVDDVLGSNADKVAEYKNGKDKLLAYFVGQVMQKTNGKASPSVVNDLLIEKLKSRSPTI